MSEMLSTLFQEWLINKSQKLEILLRFVPILTLKEAKRFKLIGDAGIKKHIEEVVLDGVDSTQKSDIYQKLKKDLEEISIDTKVLVWNSEDHIDKVATQKGFQEIAQQAKDLYTLSQKEGPKNLQEFQTRLSEMTEKIRSPENLSQGSIMEVEISADGKTSQVQYYEIFATSSEGNTPNIISFQNKWWEWVYISKKQGRLDKKSYQDFIDFANFDTVKNITFTDKTHFEQKIASGKITEDTGDFVYRTWTDKEGRILRHKNQLEERLIQDNLMKQWDDLDAVIWWFDDDQREQYADVLQWFENEARLNTFHLQQDLDKFDSEGKEFGFEKWTAFETKEGEQYSIVTIEEGEHEWKIWVALIWGEIQVVSFENFLNTFKQKNCKRKAKVIFPEGLIDDINNPEQLWEWIEYKNGDLVNKKDPKNEHVCDYLAAKDKGSSFWRDYNVLKIHNISGDKVEVGLWKIKKGEKKEDPTTYNTSRNTITVSLAILSIWIKKAGLLAQNIKQENIQEDFWEGNDEMHGNLWARYLKNFASISTVVQAGKSYIEFFEQYLKEWRDEQASRLVAKLPVLTAEQRSAAITHLENAEKKRMEEFLEKLKIRDSIEATEMVARWLLNNDSLEAQKEAAIFYMIEKYWVLYSKSPLIKHKGSWLWYKALGGQVWDELFREQEAKAKEYGIQFTEEDLVYILLLLQGRWKRKPKRRGKLYKEYEAILGKWLEAEIEKWQKDADKKRTPEQREQFAILEAAWGGWPNSFWAMESLVNKWFDGNISKLNSIPFVLMTSWAAYSFAPGKADNFKNGMIPTQFFTAKKPHIDAYNNAVVALAYDIENKLWSEYNGMGKTFDDLINKGIWLNDKKERKKLNEAERVNYSYNLFKDKAGGKWWETLSRALLRLNTRKSDTESEFETWIWDHLDNWVYATYQWIFEGGLEATKDARFKNEVVLKDGFKMHENELGTWWMSGFDVYETVKQFIQPVTGWYGFRNKDLGMMFWQEITGQIDSIASNSNLEENYKRSRIGNILKEFMDAMSESYGQRANSVQEIMNNPGDIFYQRFKKWDVQEGDFSRLDWDFRKGGGINIINRYVDNIVSAGQLSTGSWWSIDSTKEYSLNDITWAVQERTVANLNKTPEELK
jgi:hypothetical protein